MSLHGVLRAAMTMETMSNTRYEPSGFGRLGGWIFRSGREVAVGNKSTDPHSPSQEQNPVGSNAARGRSFRRSKVTPADRAGKL
jgi:hypothetical protein